MYDFVPRIDNSATDSSVASRVVPAVSPIQSVGTASGSANDGGVASDSGEEARRQHMASAADYARAHAQIAQILSEMSNAVSSAALQEAVSARMDSMVSRSTVIVPLPPATTESMERAIEVARAMVQKAALARSSHSSINAGTVSQITAEA